MNAAALRAMEAVISPGSVPALRKLLVMLTLRRATGASSCGTKDVSIAASELEVPSSLTGVGCFVPLSEIAEVAKGPTGIKGAKPGPYPLVVTAEDRGTCDHFDFEGEAVLVPMVSSTGHGDASLKRIHYQEGRFAVGSILAAIQVRDPGNYSPRFLYEYLSSFKDELLVARMSGTANVSLTVKKIAAVPVPVIRIADQRRLHDLMRLCDALEAKGRLEAQQHARLLETLLGTLTDSTTPEELAANWQRVAEHFDLLMDRPEAVDVLEQTVLQLAVRGLLVPQDPREEPGRVLLEQIQAAKAAGPTNSKNHRVRAELPEVGDHELPFEPPPGWVWTRFGEVTHVSGGVTLGRKGAIAKPLSLPYLRVANVQRWKLAMESLKDVVIDESELPRYQLVNGDLLITEGGDWDKVGRTSIWRGELPICLHQNHVFKARGYIGAWHPGWAELYLNLDIARSYFAASAKQTTNLASINMTELRHCAFPLPPRAEQDRILARATELRKLCADLRRRLAASQATQSQLAEALIDSATA